MYPWWRRERYAGSLALEPTWEVPHDLPRLSMPSSSYPFRLYDAHSNVSARTKKRHLQTSRSHTLSIVYSQGSAEKNHNISKHSLKVAKYEMLWFFSADPCE